MARANINAFLLIILRRRYKGSRLSVTLYSNAHLVTWLHLSPITRLNTTSYCLNKLIADEPGLRSR